MPGRGVVLGSVVAHTWQIKNGAVPPRHPQSDHVVAGTGVGASSGPLPNALSISCLLYTSDAADDTPC
eukprot:8320007-Pyramimonas_sp.AAC.1